MRTWRDIAKANQRLLIKALEQLREKDAENGRLREQIRDAGRAETRLRVALLKIQQWDCLNPPATWIADSRWLRAFVDDALDSDKSA